ncbi:hypothetical protein C6T59_18765 [Burkholderia multivorans]|nr:hypothetical protein [Burkholderia multivorans]MDN8009205.1 hypothetical protein [Burkholderia multivorans]PRE96291.1 hypothetical protein C6Q01_29110 [Burkholderia multivorans]PRG64330.1 hypothetical protein C6T59_18765 [Burkholderia multivorans]
MFENQPKMDRNLNLVFDLENGVYAYVMPISLDIWRSYRIPLAMVLEEIRSLQCAGLSVAADLFRESCEKRGVDAEPFFAEIKRCTTVGFADSEEGFKTLPFGVAKAQGKITDEGADEIANFTSFWLASLLAKWARGLSYVALSLSQVVGTSSTFTDFLDSLQTSTTVDASDEKTTKA